MRWLFPPGGTPWRQPRPPSPWQVFALVLKQVHRAIEPALPLAHLLDELPALARAMQEPPRRRKLQLETFFATAMTPQVPAPAASDS